MSVLIAIGHIFGAIIVLIAFGAGTLILADWQSEGNQKVAQQEISLALGIPVDHLDNQEHQEKIIHFAAERYSSELFRNRLSDLCGWIQTGWGWLSNLLQVGILLGVIWYTLTDGPSNSVYAWWVVGVAIFFWMFSMIFGYVCKLLTGRFPGQAKQVRKLLAEAVKKQSA
ncbi:MAG: hypothetical protein WA056_08145 [Gallionella sp.]